MLFPPLLLKCYFGVYRQTLDCKRAFCCEWMSVILIVNSHWQFV